MQEKIRPGYKQTEIGVIPEDWVCAPLNSLGEILTGGTPPTGNRALWGSGYPWVTPSDIKGCRDIFETERSITAAGIGHLRALPENTVLVTCIASIGKNAILRRAGSCNQQINAIVPRSSYSAEFIYYLMEHSVDRLKANAGITATAIISKKTFGSLLFAVPNFIEQSAIAAALSDSDARIAALDALIAKKRDLKQAAMQQLLTGKTRLPGFSGDWEAKRLGEITHIKTGKRNNQDKMETGEFPFFVRSETVERIDSYSHDCEAILVPGEGNIGNIFHYINGKFDVHQRVYAITQFAENVSGKYVHLWMRMNFGAHAMQNTVKATVDSLRLPTFQNFQLLMPPTIDEQTAIAEILSDMDAELAALDAEAEKARTIKQGMMQNLLTGKVRLV